MKLIRPTIALALLTASTACTAEQALVAQSSAPIVATAVATAASQVSLLFVVDGVKVGRDQLPLLTDDRIFAVRVIKGRAAIERYGREASYGVVIILTKQGAAPRA